MREHEGKSREREREQRAEMDECMECAAEVRVPFMIELAFTIPPGVDHRRTWVRYGALHYHGADGQVCTVQPTEPNVWLTHDFKHADGVATYYDALGNELSSAGCG